MIAIDTNVLLRFLVMDDPAQAAKSVELIERAVQEQQRVFVSYFRSEIACHSARQQRAVLFAIQESRGRWHIKQGN